MKLRCAIVGYGVIGHVHVKIARNYGELCAVCDTDPSALESIEPELRYNDYVTMLEQVRPDVVHICTPHYLHADMVIEALNRGINVLCEKPLCMKKEDIDRILEAEKNSSAMLGVCLQNRYNAANRFVKDHFADHAPTSAHGLVLWHRDADYYASGEWRGKWATEGGGVLINQALHTLDLLIWICGEPDSMVASIANLTLADYIEVEDTATLVCDGRVPFMFNASNANSDSVPVELTFLSAEGAVKVMPKQVTVGDKLYSFTEPYKGLGKECYGSGHEALISDFYDCISSGRRFAIDGSEGAKSVKLILGAYESHGKKIKLN